LLHLPTIDNRVAVCLTLHIYQEKNVMHSHGWITYAHVTTLGNYVNATRACT